MSIDTPPTSDDELWESYGDYYNVMLLNTDTQPPTILVHLQDDQWGLPYFEYPEILLNGGRIPKVCKDFKSWLGITTHDIYFTGSVELNGERLSDSRVNPGDSGRVQLLLVEPHGVECKNIELTQGAQWKHAEFVPSIFPKSDGALYKIMRGVILECLDQSSGFLESLSDERYRPGWFKRASAFLVQLIQSRGATVHGHVVQWHMSYTSTMLLVNSSLGNYFLKSPASGCNETSITAIVAELFPDMCPSVKGISKELNCFVSYEFDHNKPEDIKDAVMALGRLQRKSVEHVERLAEAGCAVRKIEKVAEAANEWPQKFLSLNRDPDCFSSMIPVIEELCEELKEFRIPMALVHGDFSLGNVGFAERDGRRDLVIFDWQYAYIGHPFCDFHRVHKHISEDVRDGYLKLWSDFEDIDRARRAYNIARKLGWAMKAWSALEWALAGNAQDPPVLANFAMSFAISCRVRLCPRGGLMPET